MVLMRYKENSIVTYQQSGLNLASFCFKKLKQQPELLRGMQQLHCKNRSKQVNFRKHLELKYYKGGGVNDSRTRKLKFLQKLCQCCSQILCCSCFYLSLRPVLIQLIQIHVKESDVIQTQSVSSSFLAGDDCVFVRKVGKETDEPVLVCGLKKLSICRENPAGNRMLFHLTHRWLDGRKMLIFTCLLENSCFSRMNYSC